LEHSALPGELIPMLELLLLEFFEALTEAGRNLGLASLQLAEARSLESTPLALFERGEFFGNSLKPHLSELLALGGSA